MFGDQRTHQSLRIHWIADLDLSIGLHEGRGKGGGDLLLKEETSRGRAALAGSSGRAKHHAAQSETEIRILSPDKSGLVVTSQPTTIELAEGGFTDNVSFFVNVVFPNAGTYWIQTIANTVVLDEFPLIVTDSDNMEAMQPADEITETIN